MNEVLSKSGLSVEEKLRHLEEKRKKLLMQSREKNKRVNQKKILEISRLIEKAKIQDIDSKTLFGAFLEIAEKSMDKKNLTAWESKANEMESCESMIIISFIKEPITNEAKKILKELGFRFNSFRNEYYGKGTIENIKFLFKSFDCKVELVS
jgi:hypothetical protein